MIKPAPSIKNPPSHMNPEAESVWSHVVRHFADEIYEPKTLRDQWEKAKGHFHRICKLKGIDPYNKYEKAAEALDRLARKI